MSVAAVRESVEAHGAAYLERVYTAGELDGCRGPGGIAPERLAARFAAKEAAMKVLRPAADDAVPWDAIEVLGGRGDWVSLRLGGEAAELADREGIESLELSITHEGESACAVVIAELREGCR